MLSRKPWKPERVVWLFGALLACYALGTIVVQGYLWAISKDDSSKAQPNVLVMMLGTFVSQGVGLVLVGVFLREHHTSWREAFGFRTERLGRTIPLAIFTAVVVLPIAWSLAEVSTWLLIKLHTDATPQQSVRALQNAVSLSQKIYFGLMAVVMAPIVEEIIFRGVLYPAIKQEGFVKSAVWATSILFAWTHFNLMTFVPLMFLGVILTFLYETTDNLLAPILTHSLFNAANFFWLLHQMKS
jgi:membrane protease YdiL (CAAX protease family)